MVNKAECLECLFTEINILTECRHPNVVKILDASFDGTLVKEQPLLKSTKTNINHKKQQYVESPINAHNKGCGSKADKTKNRSYGSSEE